MGYSIDFEKVSDVSHQFFATRRQSIIKLIEFFTLTNEECRDAGIDVGGEGRAEEGTISALSSPKET